MANVGSSLSAQTIVRTKPTCSDVRTGPSSASLQHQCGTMDYSDMKILIIEDDHLIAQSLKKGLTQEHFAVDIVHDGIEGYDLAVAEAYDVIILDRMLPGKDGVALCRELRASKKTTPVLMLTAKSQTNDKIAGLNAGADDYLAKPFAFEELLARVRALLRRPQTVVSDVLTIRDLTLDSATYTVQRAGTAIAVSHREFALLEYLMRQHGRTVSKETIMTHVWEYDAEILPNTIEVYIKNLRQKIDSPFPDAPPLIQTVRGFGYKIA